MSAPTTAPQSKPRGAWWAAALSVVIGIALLALAARNLDLSSVINHFRSMDGVSLALALLAYAALFGVVHVLRMWRWAYLLRHLGDFSLGQVLRAAAVGFTAIILLPLRLGELVRPYMLARETGCSMSAALGTAVVERVVDGLFISLLLFLTLATYEGAESTAFAAALGYACLGIFASALVVLLLAIWRREQTLGALERLISLISAGLAGKIVGLLRSFLDGVESLREGKALASFLALTLAYWGINGLSIAFLGWFGFGLMLGPWAGMTVLAILVVGIMIPTGPGLAGNYELFALEALGLFLPPEEVRVAGAAFVASMHAVQFVVQALPGLILLWVRRDSLSALRREAQQAAADQARGPS